MGMEKRDLLSIVDLSKEDILAIVNLAADMKSDPGSYSASLSGRMGALVFEKPSLRTRVTFEAAIHGMGGHPVYLSPQDIQLGKRETVEDVAHNLERWVQVIIARTFKHDSVVGLARNASVPVINALSDREHPCQAVADLLTLKERFGEPVEVKLAYVGDGNNTCVSLLLAVATIGGQISIATPSGYSPPEPVLEKGRALAKQSGARIEVMSDPSKAVAGAHAVYTDTWISMGQESQGEGKAVHFRDYRVDSTLMAKADPQAVFMHCLPAHRSYEVEAAVIDGPQSIVFDQAENRLYAQKAILHHLMVSSS